MNRYQNDIMKVEDFVYEKGDEHHGRKEGYGDAGEKRCR